MDKVYKIRIVFQDGHEIVRTMSKGQYHEYLSINENKENIYSIERIRDK